MKTYLPAHAGTAAVMVAWAMLWLGVIAKPLYQQGIGHLMADQPRIAAAVLFYLPHALGVVIFAVSPQNGGATWPVTLVMAALFGFLA